MSLIRLFITTLLIFSTQYCAAQANNILQIRENIQTHAKYPNSVENKINRYSDRITGKKEKALTKPGNRGKFFLITAYLI